MTSAMKKMVFYSAGVLFSILAVFFCFSTHEDVPSHVASVKHMERAKVRGPSSHKRTLVQKKKTSSRGAPRPNQAREKPTLNLEADEEQALTPLYRQLLDDLRNAFETNDQKKLLRLVVKMQQAQEWPDEIPTPIKLLALEALGWFGPSCLPEIAGFLVDENKDVLTAAIENYENIVSDPDLSESERAHTLVLACRVIQDPESLDRMMMELTTMRNSTACQALADILETGNASAQQVLPQNIAFITGEEAIQSRAGLEHWLQENPDDPE